MSLGPLDSGPHMFWRIRPIEGMAAWLGDNRGFHWLFSFLTFSARFVRDGYLRFRYGVDAEQVGFNLLKALKHLGGCRNSGPVVVSPLKGGTRKGPKGPYFHQPPTYCISNLRLVAL